MAYALGRRSGDRMAGKFTQATQILMDSNAWANLLMRQSQAGGFQTRPYDARFFLRFLRSLRPVI
jgi:hypothetical protein